MFRCKISLSQIVKHIELILFNNSLRGLEHISKFFFMLLCLLNLYEKKATEQEKVTVVRNR